MRVVFIGAGDLTVETATLLIDRKHEVVIIEEDKEKVTELSDLLDCSFLHGDGSKPHVLEDAGPKHTDILFCLTDNDQHNIIAALVGRSLGYRKIVLQIHDADYLNICRELKLENPITPSKTIGRYLADMASGIDVLELSSLIKGEARCLMVKIDEDTRGKVEDLDLPDEARAICFYREGEFKLTSADTKLQLADEVIILTHSKHLAELTRRFNPENSETESEADKDHTLQST